MKLHRSITLCLAATVLGLAGCGADLAKQVTTNEQLRTQVLDALASRPELAMQAVDRMVSSDSLRVQVVDHLLGNEEVSKQVLVRVGSNAAAMDLVMGIAVRDSALRQHLVTLVHGMEMASAK